MNTTVAYLIHSFPYSDSRIICRFYTLDYGRVSLIARKKISSKSHNRFQVFRPYEISFQGKGELKSLNSCEESGVAMHLHGKRLYCAMYINELIDRLTVEDGCNVTLYREYESCLHRLCALGSDEMFELEPVLRMFELSLLEECGFAIDFYHTDDGDAVSKGNRYEYQEDCGIVRASSSDNSIENNYPASSTEAKVFDGATLLAIADRDFSDPLVRKSAKSLLRKALLPLVGNKPIKSRELFLSY